MDTDSLYFDLSTKTVEEAARPERREAFEASKTGWFTWEKWSGREPGLFKLEFENYAENAISWKSKTLLERRF